MDRTFECPAWIFQGKDRQLPPSEFAEEGTRAHQWIDKVLAKYLDCPEEQAAARELALEKMVDKIKHAENYEMADCVARHLRFIKKIENKFLADAEPGWERLIEAKVTLNNLVWGTLDYALIAKRTKDGKSSRDIVVVDYKHGKGVEVSAEENLQLITYCCCLAQRFKDGEVDRFIIFIHQPRASDELPKPWVMTGAEMITWRERILEAAKKAYAMQQGTLEPHYKAGDHCRWCPGQMDCRAFTRDAQKETLIALSKVAPLPVGDPSALTVKQRANIHRWKKRIEHFLELNAAMLIEETKAGLDTGFKLVEGRTQRRWNPDLDPSVIAAKLAKRGVRDPWKDNIINIGDVEREIGEGKIGDLITRTEAKWQIAELDDEREPVDFQKNIRSMLTPIGKT